MEKTKEDRCSRRSILFIFNNWSIKEITNELVALTLRLQVRDINWIIRRRVNFISGHIQRKYSELQCNDPTQSHSLIKRRQWSNFDSERSRDISPRFNDLRFHHRSFLIDHFLFTLALGEPCERKERVDRGECSVKSRRTNTNKSFKAV